MKRSHLNSLFFVLVLTLTGVFYSVQAEQAQAQQVQPLAQSEQTPQTEVSEQQALQSTPSLDSPRRSLHTFVYWQLKGHYRPEFAARTMKLADNEVRIELSQKLLKVLDARGLEILFDEIPASPTHRDSLSGQQIYILFDELPEVYLIRDGNDWVFAQSTVAAIPDLYRDTFSVFVDVVLDHLPTFMKNDVLGMELWQYVGIFVWILLGLVFMKLFDFGLGRYIEPLLQKTNSQWDDQFYQEVHQPIGYIFLFTFFRLTYTNLMLPVKANTFLSNSFEVALSIAVVWFLYKLANVASLFLESVTSKTDSKLDDQLVPLLRKSLKIFIVVIGVLFVLQNNGINVTSLIAGLGIGGLAFALAAQDTLANFFGSITIFVDKPFQIGDLITTGDVTGTIEEVGFRSTRIRTLYNSLVTIPNAKLADAEIDNLGLRKMRRLRAMVNLTYDTTPEHMEAFVEGVKGIIRTYPSINQETYEVHFHEMGAHSLDVLINLFFEVPTWSEELQFRHNFLLDVMRLAKEVGVEFAFPTQTLHVGSHIEGAYKAPTPKSSEQLAAAATAFGPGGSLSHPEGIQLTKDGKAIDFSANK